MNAVPLSGLGGRLGSWGWGLRVKVSQAGVEAVELWELMWDHSESQSSAVRLRLG